MQFTFDLGQSGAYVVVRNRLLNRFGPVAYEKLADPMDQFVGSILASRTQDEVSLQAFQRLLGHYRGDYAALAKAAPKEIERQIWDVQFADKKAVDIVAALRRLKAISGDLHLEFLRDWDTDESLRYLEGFHGVGRKIAAATLNFSTLAKPALVLDTHVLRVLGRFGFISLRMDDAEPAYEKIMPSLAAWTAAELYEFHRLLKRLGQEVCQARRTHCAACPLESPCSKRGTR